MERWMSIASSPGKLSALCARLREHMFERIDKGFETALS
jgi:hypothetical protein